MNTHLRRLRSWLEVADPGSVRRRDATRAALVVFTTWLTLRYTTIVVNDSAMPGVVLFGVAAGFAGSLVIADPARHQRLVTMILAAFVFAGSVVLTASMSDWTGARFFVLLVFIFASFALRRYGLRAGELALMATMAVYFALSNRTSFDQLGWYLVAIAVAFAWLGLWQFVLLPYRPLLSIERASRAFYERAGELVGEVRAHLSLAAGSQELDKSRKRLNRHLGRVRTGRRVIERQFPGLLSPRAATAEAVGHLQLEIFSAEQGLALMVESATESDWMGGIEHQLSETILEVLGELEAALRTAAAPESMEQLAAGAATLREQLVAAYSSAASQDEGGTASATSAVQLARGAQQLARSVAAARAVVIELRVLASAEAPVAASRAAQAAAPVPQGQRFHPTTVLGLQAVVATALAMLIAVVLDLPHVNWVFWTAFLVVAGSAGESLRRMVLRVAGTVAGTAVGVGVALALPEGLTVGVAIAVLSLFMAIYSAPVSYTRMVFWLNFGVVVVFSHLGAQELSLLADRPLAATVGGAVAALVSVTLFRVQVTDRYRKTLSQYLATIGAATNALVAARSDASVRSAAVAAAAKADLAYEQVKLVVEAAAFESSPFPRAETPIADQAVRVAAVDESFRKLASRAAETEVSTDGATAQILPTLLPRITADIAQMQAMLASGTVWSTAANPAASASPTGQVQVLDGEVAASIVASNSDSPEWAIAGLHRSLVQLAQSLGAPRTT